MTYKNKSKTTLDTCFVLAAGRGERLEPITINTPKPLVKIIKNKTLIDYHLEKLQLAGFTRVVINVRYLRDKIINHLANKSYDLDLIFSPEDKELDTGGGIKNAIHLIERKFFALVNADIFTDYDFKKLQKIDLQEKFGHIKLVANPAHNKQGDFGIVKMDNNTANNDFGLLEIAISSKKQQKFTYTGMGVFASKMFTDYKSTTFSLGERLKQLAKEDLITAEVINNYWNDVGTVERLKQVRIDANDIYS